MKGIALALALSCGAGAAQAESISFSFGAGGYPQSSDFTIQGFDSSLGTLYQAVIATTGNATFTLSATGPFAPTVTYSLGSSQSIYQRNGPATYTGPTLSGSGTASYTDPNGSPPDFTYVVGLQGTGLRTYSTLAELQQFVDADITAYFQTDAPLGSLTSGNVALNYQVVSATTSASGSITYFYNTAAGSVPEPTTWALMVLGFGAAGGAVRRRRRAGAEAAQPAVTKLSITRLRPACSKSISSLLPSTSAMVP